MVTNFRRIVTRGKFSTPLFVTGVVCANSGVHSVLLGDVNRDLWVIKRRPIVAMCVHSVVTDDLRHSHFSDACRTTILLVSRPCPYVLEDRHITGRANIVQKTIVRRGCFGVEVNLLWGAICTLFWVQLHFVGEGCGTCRQVSRGPLSFFPRFISCAITLSTLKPLTEAVFRGHLGY